MVTLFPLGGGTVHAVSLVYFLRGDHDIVRGLTMRTSAEWATHTFKAALGMMMAPPVAPSAQDRAGMGFSSGDTAIDTGDIDKLADELLCRSSRYGVFDIDPRNAGVRVGRHSHDARDASKDVE